MDQLKGLILQGIMKAIKLKRLKISVDWIVYTDQMGKWTTYLMKVYLGKLCVSSNLIQCKSAIHVICLSFLEICARPPVTPDRAFNDSVNYFILDGFRLQLK